MALVAGLLPSDELRAAYTVRAGWRLIFYLLVGSVMQSEEVRGNASSGTGTSGLRGGVRLRDACPLSGAWRGWAAAGVGILLAEQDAVAGVVVRGSARRGGSGVRVASGERAVSAHSSACVAVDLSAVCGQRGFAWG